MRIKFNCNECKTNFLMDNKWLSKREAVICPTCNKELDKVILEDLKTLSVAYDKFRSDREKVLSATNADMLFAKIELILE